MNKMLEIKTKLRLKDALRYNLHIASSQASNYLLLVIGLIGLGMFINNMITGDASLDVRFSKSFVLLIPPFLFMVNVPLKVWKASAVLLSNPILKDDVVYVFDLDKVSFKTSQGEADVTWDSYVKIVETNHDFRFFMDKVQAQIIPKYSLDDQEIQGLRDIIGQAADAAIINIK